MWLYKTTWYTNQYLVNTKLHIFLHIISSELNCFLQNKYQVDLNRKSVCNVYILISNCLFPRLSNTKFARIFRPVTFVNFNLLTFFYIPFCDVYACKATSTLFHSKLWRKCTVESLLMLTKISKRFKLTFWITFLAIPLLVGVGLEVLEHTLILLWIASYT